MSSDWDKADLWRVWTLTPEELDRIMDLPARLRLGYAVQLKLYVWRGKFAAEPREVPDDAVDFIAKQIGADASEFLAVDWLKRTGRRDREDISAFLDVRRMKAADLSERSAWLESTDCPLVGTVLAMAAHIYGLRRDGGLKSPTADKIDRIARDARHRFEDSFFEPLCTALSPDAIKAMENSLERPDEATGFHGLKADPASVVQRIDFDQKLAA